MGYYEDENPIKGLENKIGSVEDKLAILGNIEEKLDKLSEEESRWREAFRREAKEHQMTRDLLGQTKQRLYEVEEELEEVKGVKKKRASKRKKPEFEDSRFGRAQERAWMRKIEWGLSKEEYERLVLRSCYSCGDGTNVDRMGLLRINTTKGYEMSNVKPCCRSCLMDRGRQ